MAVPELSICIVWTIQIVLLLSFHCNACTPCEENTNCEIVYSFEYDENLPSSLIWKRDGVDICTCFIETECLIYPEFQQEIKASIQQDAGTVTSMVTVLNATRASGWTGSKWELFAYSAEGTLTLMHTCDLKIYRKINNTTCDYNATESGLSITCTSTNVYPESACDFTVKFDNIYQLYELSSVYKNTVVKKDPVYYKSVCTTEIAEEKLKPGLWEIDTTIFPDVYKNGTNCELCNSGQLFRFNITIEMPAVSLFNCPKVVDEGDEIVCICQREDKSDIQTYLNWETGGTENFDRYAILKANAWKNNTGFTCSAINMFGFLTKVNYSIALNKITKVTNAIAFSNNTTHIILIKVIVCVAILIVFGIWLVRSFKRNQKPRRSLDSSSTPLQKGNDIPDSLGDIICTLVVLKKDPVKSSISKDLTARTFKKKHLHPDKKADEYDVVIRFSDGVEDIMNDEEEFGEERLKICESVRIVEKGLKYTATTCPGSSGGPVFILNNHFGQRFKTKLVGDYPLHSGANSGGINYSGVAQKPTLSITNRSNTAHDSHYTAFAEGGVEHCGECFVGQGEVDLHTHLSNCEKNPGHKNFVPVNQFTLEHLPAGYQDNDLYDYIKALSDLTGRVAVKLTSPDRPEFVPGTKDHYPCYNTRGQNSLRTATATLVSVMKIDNSVRTCPCPECDHSDTPSEVFFLVYMLTAAHVVFDDSEARQCSIRSWFNDDKSPVVKMYGWRVVEYDGDLTHNRKLVEFVTHDVDIGERLLEMINRLNHLDIKIFG